MQILKLIVLSLMALVINVPSTLTLTTQQLGTHQKLISQKFLNLFKPNREDYLNSHGIYVDTTAISNLCPKHVAFQSMNRNHMEAVGRIRKILTVEPDLEKAIRIAEYLKHDPNVNVMAWYNAVMAWALKDPRMEAIPKPSPVDISPDEFINNVAMADAYRRMESSTKIDECIVIDGSAGVDNGPENALWYFREDLMLNAHHQFYHLSYPVHGDDSREDRRGELFYYFHRDALARYNAERLSHNMSRVKGLEWGVGSIMEQGYYAHLNETATGRQYSDRAPNTPLSDLDLSDDQASIRDMEIIRNRLLVTGESGIFILANGSTLLINNFEGIDIFSDAVEENVHTLNSDYYGKGLFGLHNIMHTAIANSHDPEGEFELPPGVMRNIATSFRDTIFYKWHMYLNDMFDVNKKTLTPYTPNEGELPLIWNGITVNDIEIQLVDDNSSTRNQFHTYFTEKEFPLKKGLDHGGNFTDPPLICAKHLDHEEFYYRIVVNSTHPSSVPATIRIFLSPRYDETGARFDMLTQRDFLFNLDVFTTNLTQGENTIWRRSNETSAAVPWHKTIDELENDESPPRCGCGFPMHLQIPRGKPEGMAYDLVVLVTNGEDDAVQHEETSCAPAYLYCGLLNTRYPDAKPMGYPFDRLPYSVDGAMVPDLDSYVGNVPNMRTVQVNISHVEN